jgi:nucleotide-binding universal stress UspA family protein
MKFDHIIVPTDFSECSIHALRYAAEIAKKQDSHIHLLHVYQRPYVTTAYNGGLSAAVDPQMHAQIREEVYAELKKLANLDFVKGLHVSAKLMTDMDAWKFYEELDYNHADLIVMGTHGVTGLLHGGLFGTNTERVIRHAPVPVISVPEGTQFESYDKILFAADFKEDYDSVFPDVVKFAKLFDAEIEVAVINTHESYATSKEASDRFELLKQQNPYDKMKLVIYNEDTVTEGIRDLSLKHDINLIAMRTHGRTGMSRLLRDSITEDVSATIKTPVLALKSDYRIPESA